MDRSGVALNAGRAMKKFVRVTGARLGRFVEFSFWINDVDLCVELILPVEAFEEFCRAQEASLLPPEPAVAEELERQAWRARQPGLLRRIAE